MVDTAQIKRFVITLYGQAKGRDGVHAFVTALDPLIPGGEKRVATRDIATVIAHAERHDRPGRAVYACVNMLRSTEQRRSKEALGLLVTVHVDLDFKDVAATPDEAMAAVANLRIQPTMCVMSGGGAHLYWVLSDPLEATEANIELVEGLNERAADVLGAAKQTRDVSRLLRIPGTHNSKRGSMVPVVISETIGTGEVHDADTLDAWLSEQGPVLRPVEAPERAAVAENPWLAVARTQGFKAPIDVEQRLAVMSFGAAGDASIHQTQLQVSASLISRGMPAPEVEQILLDATRGAAGEYGARWNWRREEQNIAKIVAGAVAKFPPKPAASTPKGMRQEETSERQSAAAPKLVASGGSAVADVVHLDERRGKKDRKAKSSNTPKHIEIGNIVIGAMKERGVGVIFTPRGAWRCTDGIWSLAADGLKGWLDVEIETACRAVGVETANRLVSETRAYVMRDPGLWREDVAWDRHGKIPTASGLFDLATGDCRPIRPDDFCTWRVAPTVEPEATCPWWLVMLDDAFADRSAEDRRQEVGTIQELAGASLIDGKSKALSKALILEGGSNSGKSQILEVLSGLHGDEPIAADIDALEGAHGLMPFLRRAPWVLHEAFDQRKWHFSSAVKAIVEAKPVHINIKNGPMLNQRVRSPIFWGTNTPPQFREATRAIVNRLVIIKCRQEFLESEPVGAAIEARRLGYDSPASLILATEMPGVLQWAIEGLRRAMARGYIEQSAEMRETADEVHRDGNLSAGFVDECVEFDRDSRISAPDFCAAFSVWWLESKGENRNTPSNDSIGRALSALADRRIAIAPKELRDNRRRYYCGMRLNEAGLRFWERAVESELFSGKTASTTSAGGHPNESIPGAWADKPSVIAMRRAFDGPPGRKPPPPGSEIGRDTSGDTSGDTSSGEVSRAGEVSPSGVTSSDTDWGSDTTSDTAFRPRERDDPLF